MTPPSFINLLFSIGSQPDPLAKVVEFVLTQFTMESLFLGLMLSKNEKAIRTCFEFIFGNILTA